MGNIDIWQVCDRMLALKATCLHPLANKPYVKMAMGGIDNSPEGKQVSLRFAFKPRAS
jgi:hypothetical protein